MAIPTIKNYYTSEVSSAAVQTFTAVNRDAGDLLIFVGGSLSVGATVSAGLTGWTNFALDTSQDPGLFGYYITATDASTADIVITYSVPSGYFGCIMVVENATPHVYASGVNTNGAKTSDTLETLTTTENDCLVIHWIGVDAGLGTYTLSSGATSVSGPLQSVSGGIAFTTEEATSGISTPPTVTHQPDQSNWTSLAVYVAGESGESTNYIFVLA